MKQCETAGDYFTWLRFVIIGINLSWKEYKELALLHTFSAINSGFPSPNSSQRKSINHPKIQHPKIS